MKLTPTQRLLLRCSAAEVDRNGNGYGVDLRGSGGWTTARALEARDLGWIEGTAGTPSIVSTGRFFANPAGIAAVAPASEGSDV
jgi:hypothetical protein